MPVLTEEQYELFKQKKSEKDEKLSDQIFKADKVKEDKVFEWVLIHPEIPIGESVNFEDTLVLEGKGYTRICKNNLVTTTERVLAEFLIKKGYRLHTKKEVSND